MRPRPIMKASRLKPRACLGLLVAGFVLGSQAQVPKRAARAAFPPRRASYLYTPPAGAHADIGAWPGVAALRPALNVHGNGYDYPVQFSDGTHGATTFDDFGWWHRRDRIAVPNVGPGGGFHPSTGTDGHLVVINTVTRRAYEFWRLCANAAGAPVTCPGNRSPTSVGWIGTFSLDTSNGVPGGGTASGLSGLAGLILPGEIEHGIDHALSVIVPGAMNSPRLCSAAPASHTDGTAPGGVFCEGAKLRLDPSVQVDALPATPAAKAILLALQRFGGVITDQSDCAHCLNFYTALDGPAPDLTGLAPALLPHLWIYDGR